MRLEDLIQLNGSKERTPFCLFSETPACLVHKIEPEEHFAWVRDVPDINLIVLAQEYFGVGHDFEIFLTERLKIAAGVKLESVNKEELCC